MPICLSVVGIAARAPCGDLTHKRGGIGDAAGEALATAIAESVQAECKLRGAVELVAPDTLPNDGKVIDDTREYG